MNAHSVTVAYAHQIKPETVGESKPFENRVVNASMIYFPPDWNGDPHHYICTALDGAFPGVAGEGDTAQDAASDLSIELMCSSREAFSRVPMPTE